MIAALEGGEWSAARPGRTLPPGKTRYPLYRRLGGPQGRSGRVESLVSTGIRPRTFQPVVQSIYRLSYWAHNFQCYVAVIGDRGSTVVKVLCYKSEGRWFDPSWFQWIFHWHKILPITLRSWGRRNLEQKWVPGAFPGGKSGRCVRLTTLPPSCAVVTKSESFDFLEPSGTDLRSSNYYKWHPIA